jgi:KaiC/GvpD/RAD55 family RecA-like ATPase
MSAKNRLLDEELHGIVLGYPLDQLLNQECPNLVTQWLPDKNDDGEKNKRGILFPFGGDPGTGNIVIIGPAGSAKTTLALQIATACAQRPENRAISAYVSLEATSAEIRSKARPFLWDRHLHEVHTLDAVEDLATDEELGKALLHVLSQPREGGISKCRIATPAESTAKCETHGKRFGRLWDVFQDRGSVALAGTDFENSPVLEPMVLLTGLSPRSPRERRESDSAFWLRYRQLERLLRAASYLRTKPSRDNPQKPVDVRTILPLVVIDSLNMLSMESPEREEIYRLFGLFRQYQTAGVFVVESSQGVPFDSTMADVVIRLSMTEDNGYFTRNIEIEKSRYRNQVYGRHPFRTARLETKKKAETENGEETQSELTPPICDKHVRPKLEEMAETHEEGQSEPTAPKCDKQKECYLRSLDPPRHGVVVLPSLHYMVLRSEKMQPESMRKLPDPKRWRTPGETWGIEAMNRILPRNLAPGSVIVVEGPRGTFKTNLTLSFLAQGLRRGEHVLLIRLHGRELLPHNAADKRSDEWPALSNEVVKGKKDDKIPQGDDNTHFWSYLEPLPNNDQASGEPARRWQNLVKDTKAVITPWRLRVPWRPEGSDAPCLFEVDFKSGALLPEEVIQVLWDIAIRQPADTPILRAVLMDVREIGPAYPFLRQNSTSGNMFLPALAHIMRNNKIDLVVAGTTGELPEADEAVGRICAVADGVVSCRYLNVFGKRLVILQGEGLIAMTHRSDQEKRDQDSYAPPVVRYRKANQFEVDSRYLEGLVGFDTGTVHRPGLSVYLFQENQRMHGRYNRQLEAMLQDGFAAAPVPALADWEAYQKTTNAERLPLMRPLTPQVTVIPFDSAMSVTAHDSLQVFGQGEPIDRTVLFTVDEFSVKDLCYEKGDTPRFAPLSWENVMALPQQNSWVKFGSGRSPSVWYRAISMVS